MREIKFRTWCEQTKEMRSNIQNIGNFDNKWWEIMQFTGLKTKEGIEIYEGDIIECRDGRYVIEYIDSFAQFSMVRGDSIQDANTCMRSIKVVGNKFENPIMFRNLKEK